MGTSHAQYVNPSLVLLAGQGAAAPSQLRVCQLRAGGKVKRQSLKKVQTRFVACSSKQIILVSEPCGQVLVLLVGSFSARFVCIACILLRILIIPRAKEALTTGFRASSVLRVKEGMCIPIESEGGHVHTSCGSENTRKYHSSGEFLFGVLFRI